MDQEVRYLSIKELVLWTENPRDPIDGYASDQDIVDKAFNDNLSKWTIGKLAKEMGDHYDFSEIPTVVYKGNKPIVYDGNRRIILGKIKHNLVNVPDVKKIHLIPEFPEEIPCNICKEEIALKNIFRKHSESGSWLPLERDFFIHKYMNKEKSLFLILDEETNIITANPHLNQRFVKDEIFKEDVLEAMGFCVKNGSLSSRHGDEDGYSILADITQKIGKKIITTRKNRGKVLEVLEPSSQQLIEQNKKNKFHSLNVSFSSTESFDNKKRQTKRTPKKKTELFGGKLYLSMGKASDLYRDIMDLYKFYIDNKNTLSQTFPGIIRMSLRLLCETAAKDFDEKFEKYLTKNYKAAKKTLNNDIRTTLSSQNVREDSIIQLLHTGAHIYESSCNIDQTIALSIIIGAIITITHGRDEGI